MPSTTLTENDKKICGKYVGKTLVRKHGQQKFYSPQQVTQAAKEAGFRIDWHCWAMAMYTSPADFNAYHKALGENCNYAAMKQEMVSALTGGDASSWLGIDMSWLEWPDFDFSLPDFFDFFD